MSGTASGNQGREMYDHRGSLTADIAGGQAAGMETCWFCREKKEESELENVRRTHKADHVIKRLEELKDLL